MKLLNVVENQLKITDEARGIVPIRELIKRDKHVEKANAIRELLYIYFVCDYRSSYNNYDENEKPDRVKKDLGFDPKWRPDSQLKEAMEFYMEHQKTASIKALQESREGLLSNTKLLKLLRKSNETFMDMLEESQINGETIDLDSMDKAVTISKTIIALVSKVPDVIQTIDSLEEKVKKEQASGERVRGGGTVNPREM